MSVCLFVAALLYTAPNVEISIYSTCKRISQKLLRNCLKFLALIYDVLREKPLEFSRKSMDEVEIIGDESGTDFRKLNSYPSKVTLQRPCRAHQKVPQRPKVLARAALTSTCTLAHAGRPRMCKKLPPHPLANRIGDTRACAQCDLEKKPHRTRLRIASRTPHVDQCAECDLEKKPTPLPLANRIADPRMLINVQNAISKKNPHRIRLRIASRTPRMLINV